MLGRYCATELRLQNSSSFVKREMARGVMSSTAALPVEDRTEFPAPMSGISQLLCLQILQPVCTHRHKYINLKKKRESF